MKKLNRQTLLNSILLSLVVGGLALPPVQAQTLPPILFEDGKVHEYTSDVNVDGLVNTNGIYSAVTSRYGTQLMFQNNISVTLDSSDFANRSVYTGLNALAGVITTDGNLDINIDSQTAKDVTIYGAVAAGRPITVNGQFNVNMVGGMKNRMIAGSGELVLNGNSNVYIYAPSETEYAFGYAHHYDRRITPGALQLNAGVHNITVEADNGQFLGGIVLGMTTVDAKLGAGSITNVNIKSTNDGSVTWANNGVKGVEGRINMVSGSKLNIFFDLPTEDTYISPELQKIYRSTHGLVGLYLLQGSNMQAGSEIYMELSGAPIWSGKDLNGNKYGLGSVAGIATYEEAAVNSSVNINILSEQGVGIRIEDASNIAGKLDLNGDTIITTNRGYALISESIGYGDGDRNSNINIPARKYAEININTKGGSLVQMVGDLDHRTLRKSYFNINLDREDSFLYGASLKTNASAALAEGLTDITLANKAQWYMTADSIVNNLTFAGQGTLDMHPSGHGNYETLTATRVLGDNGNIVFSTDLQKTLDNNNVAAYSDRLVITEQSTGTHTVDVKDASLITKVQAHGYALLIEDRSQGEAQFVGGDLHKGGIFKYQPIITNIDPSGYDGVPTGSTNWYLTGFERQDEYTLGSDVNTGLLEARYSAYMNEQDTLIKRLGELRQHDKEDGVWVRIRGGKNTIADSTLKTNSYISTYIGYDKKLKSQDGAKRYVGLALSHTDNKFKYIDAASGKGQNNVLTLYGTRLGDKGHYLDLVGKVGRMSNDYQYGDASGRAANWFYSLSAEYGRSITRANGWYYEPQLQFTLGRVNGMSYTDSSGISVQADSINSAILRTGVLFGRKSGQDGNEKHTYAKIFWSREFAGQVRANMYDSYGDSTGFSRSYSGSWLTLGLGTSVNINKRANIYIDVEKAFGGKVNSGLAWQGGLRWRW